MMMRKVTEFTLGVTGVDNTATAASQQGMLQYNQTVPVAWQHEVVHGVYNSSKHNAHLLVQNAVHSNGSLASLTITDNELTLATTDGHQGVNCLDTGVQGLTH
jgi:hypothetical protein